MQRNKCHFCLSVYQQLLCLACFCKWPFTFYRGICRFHRITESQNGRVGRDLCGSSSPTPLPKQGHLQQAAQDLVQVGLLPFPLVTRPALSLFPFLTCNLCVLCQSSRYLPILLEDSQRLEEMTSFRKQWDEQADNYLGSWITQWQYQQVSSNVPWNSRRER